MTTRLLPITFRETSFSNIASHSAPTTTSEANLFHTDKIFAATWLNSNDLILGTKCNRILVLDTLTGRRIEIPPIVGHRTRQNIPSSLSAGNTAENIWKYGCVVRDKIHKPSSFAYSSSPNGISGSETVTDNEFYNRHFQRGVEILNVPNNQYPQQQQQQQYQPQQQCSGIHSLSMNPSKTLIAVGSGSPTEFIQIYKLPQFEPFAILAGHTDMVEIIRQFNILN